MTIPPRDDTPMPLKDLEIKNAKPADRPFKLSDGEGMFLLVQPNGSKLWRMKYRLGGKERLLSFGSYPEIGVAAAREKRRAAKQLLAEGKDPMAGKPKPEAATFDTFQKIAKLWYTNRKDSLCDAHAVRIWARLERDVLPELGNLDIRSIEPPDVLAMIRKIEESKHLAASCRSVDTVKQVLSRSHSTCASSSAACESRTDQRPWASLPPKCAVRTALHNDLVTGSPDASRAARPLAADKTSGSPVKGKARTVKVDMEAS